MDVWGEPMTWKRSLLVDVVMAIEKTERHGFEDEASRHHQKRSFSVPKSVLGT